MLHFKMWLCILIGLNFITMVLGYSSGYVPQSCERMLPEHPVRGILFSPQITEPPFEIQYEQGNNEEPITVILKSKQSTTFQGFMLEARERGKVDEGVPVGKFIKLEPSQTQLLTCDGSADSAVTQVNNQNKTLIKVNWTAQGADLDITFRATFVQSYKIFWDQVDVTVTRESSTPKPSPATSTTESHTGTSTTEPHTGTSTTESSTGTSTTESSTGTSTTESSTGTSTTEPHTGTSTTEPHTGTSTTESHTFRALSKKVDEIPPKPCPAARNTPRESCPGSTAESYTYTARCFYVYIFLNVFWL